MKVALRVDASISIGTGHVMRCATLANLLQKQGVDIFFICRELEGHYCDWLEEQEFKVYRLPAPASNKIERSKLTHAAWLGVSVNAEIQDSKNVLEKAGKVDWLIVDHYALDAKWEKAMRACTEKLMVIDDIADRNHDCDLLLDQNIQPSNDRYLDRVSPEGINLLGPIYALIRKEFIEARKNTRKRDGSVNRILIFFGGSDPQNYTNATLIALISCKLKNISYDVVVGESNNYISDLEKSCKQLENAKVHIQTDRMAELMNSADLMIGSAGSTTWERCSLGLPSVLVSVAENQNEIGGQVSRSRAAIFLGSTKTVSATDLAYMVKQLVTKKKLVRMMGEKASCLVDGLGTKRVTAALTGTLKITIASDEDSWINEYIPDVMSRWKKDNYKVAWVHNSSEIPKGDIVFFLSFSQIVGLPELNKNIHNLVVHESALPQGRGWSPLTWGIIEGKKRIPIVLFEASDKVDSGPIYFQNEIKFEGHELVAELRNNQAAITMELCQRFVNSYPQVVSFAKPQAGHPTYYPKRTPVDSCLDSSKTIKEQFNILRVADNKKYPAYFELYGKKYILQILKADS